ncbi:phosphate ABC transporter substrate-binding protein [Altererythrobacter aerius]|uniref:Phosphate ABC transporter substrate-binding protein n=1 Tax=Tsuneonella aeria TaxID=1837929 RepID=A0A6I4TGE5_9SPHN|nr:substrate-binding domain-containing protein [Tsuneonella aeria]MXO75687.1 phosphate ABC transporter substrate-binding protein [Tsuneonella aeria]
MTPIKTIAFASISALALAACGGSGGGNARDSIRAVGSSTVYPFAKKVAEDFVAANPGMKSPLIESTGTGGGIKLFCAGLGQSTPDIVNASRRMKASELEDCKKNGVTEVVEVQVGLDGIAFASAKGGIRLNLTPEIVYKAIAARPFGKEQTARTWRDVDPSLPAEPILVYGPPSTSGTRDALKELVLEKGCESDPAMKALKESDKDRYAQICTEVRTDGAYVDQGEQDNLIVQKIEGNPKAVGVFGYSYMEENAEKLQDQPMNGVPATYENISTFKYPGARPLYIYYKKQHVGVIPGLAEFIAQWTNSWGRDGSLSRIGFVSSPDDVQAAAAAAATNGTVMTGEELK